MIELGLQKPTEEQLLANLKESLRARKLIENEDFKWWVEKLEEGEKRLRNKLITDNEAVEFHRHQGGIITIRLYLKKLHFCAAQVETLEERLKQYDRAKQPVARGA